MSKQSSNNGYSAIEAKNLSIHYGDFTAVQDVNLYVIRSRLAAFQGKWTQGAGGIGCRIGGSAHCDVPVIDAPVKPGAVVGQGQLCAEISLII